MICNLGDPMSLRHPVMCTCVSICTRVHGWTCVCVRVWCMGACMSVRVCACVRERESGYVRVKMCVCICVCTCCVRVRMRLRVRVRVRLYYVWNVLRAVLREQLEIPMNVFPPANIRFTYVIQKLDPLQLCISKHCKRCKYWHHIFAYDMMNRRRWKRDNKAGKALSPSRSRWRRKRVKSHIFHVQKYM